MPSVPVDTCSTKSPSAAEAPRYSSNTAPVSASCSFALLVLASTTSIGLSVAVITATPPFSEIVHASEPLSLTSVPSSFIAKVSVPIIVSYPVGAKVSSMV